MKTRYDVEADALFVRFSDDPIQESEEVRPGLIVDLDATGHIVGFELLDAKQQLSAGALARLAAA